MKAPHTNVLVRMSPDLKDSLEAHAKNNLRSLTKEINERLRVSLDAKGPTLQGILAREAFAGTTPGIAPSAPITPPSTGPDGQAVTLSDIDMAMMRAFHALDIDKQMALVNFVSLFK